jgi:hypothetical protein
MYITTATELSKTAHRVSIALKGIDIKEVSLSQLVDAVREKITDKSITDKEIERYILEGNDIIGDKVVIQKTTNKKKFYLIPKNISLNTQVAVRCTCSDFYYTFAWYNADHKCLLGRRPPAYYKLTKKDGKGFKPERNPEKTPGVCKHLLLFFSLLMENRVLRRSSKLSKGFGRGKSNIDMALGRKDISKLIKSLTEEIKNEKVLRKKHYAQREIDNELKTVKKHKRGFSPKKDYMKLYNKMVNTNIKKDRRNKYDDE